LQIWQGERPLELETGRTSLVDMEGAEKFGFVALVFEDLEN
jgi:hypothetical protein